MVSEGEVCCGVVKWLILQQQRLDNSSGNKKHLAFWTDKKTFDAINSNLQITEPTFNKTKRNLCQDYSINAELLNRCWYGIENIRIPYSISNEVLPDFISHVYDITSNISETWAIEAKASSLNSIQRAYFQVISHALGVSKSYIAVPIDKKDAVQNLFNYNYGVLIYNDITKLIEEKSTQILTRAHPNKMGFLTNYLRDYHFKNPTYFQSPYGIPFRVSRISISANDSLLVLAFKIYFGHKTTNIKNRGAKVVDLRRMGFIDNDENITEDAKFFFDILERYIEENIAFKPKGRTRKIVNYFIKNIPSVQGRKLLYEGNTFGTFVSNLLHIFLMSNHSLKELIGWIKQATEESKGEHPVFSHVFTIGLKRNPLLIMDMMVAPHLDSENPVFHNPTSRGGNICVNCEHRDKKRFCFCTNLDLSTHADFQRKYNDFINEWREHVPYEFFTDSNLKERFIKTHTYSNGAEVEVLAPGFVKCLIHTDTDKTNGILKHAKILGKNVRSGIKAELCTRFDQYYLATTEK